MKAKLIFLLCLFFAFPVAEAFAQDRPLRIVAIGAHPDDADVQFGGTAALFAEMGHAVKFVSVTNGDAGHQSEGGGALARRRRAEAQEAGRRLGIDEYVVLDNHDAELLPSLHVRHQIIREIRNFDADIVLTHRPNDYHPDHRYTGTLVMDAAYLVVVPNVASDTPPLEQNPVFLYFQDGFQRPYPFQPHIAVSIDETFDTKMDALDAHESQMYEWLPWVSRTLDQVPADAQERRTWLAGRWRRPITPAVRDALEKWYGAEASAGIEHAEAFEIAEYGRRPTDEEIRRLFPMLNGE